MKLRVFRQAGWTFTCSSQGSYGMTLLEAMFVIFLLFMLAIVLLPALASKYRKSGQINCANHLKQIGIAFKIWEGDNNDKYPMAVSVTNGGAMETVATGNAIAVFQVMSNELSTPTLLVCPEDKYRHFASNFSSALTSKTVSYFVNVDGTEANPEEVLSGDDNFKVRGVPAKSGLLVLSSNTPVNWSANRHKFFGYLLMADGSVLTANNSMLRDCLHLTNSTPVRLAIP